MKKEPTILLNTSYLLFHFIRAFEKCLLLNSGGGDQ